MLPAVVFVGTVYPAGELTRLIIIDGIINRLHPDIPVWMFYWEVAEMWIIFIGMLILAYLVGKEAVK